MNDFFDSLKEIKKELVKEQGADTKKIQKAEKRQEFSKEEAIAHKEDKLRDEFLAYIKNSDIRKI
ncbi:hypothetical protein [Campylobacter mucosalis]|uniref:Uncharacterized protein n=1 Tax=Campylobacter mucosalis CCUG 21559 TaxID=1032067 RepID=A0A6G5QHU9_9BACT|nr:hypothetical protein [Campylobacter mucosalis]QCD45202.1 hypothetical protein CMUC_1438 [Campylobacter mucosalis CCUG 21559]